MKKIMMIIAMLIMFCVSAAFAGDYRKYTVKKGDTLSEIAWFLKVPREKIVEWNPETGIHLIYPGQKLKYYIAPDTTDIINQVDQSTKETIEAMTNIVPIIQEGNEKIRKIIRKNHDGLTRQIGQVQAKQINIRVKERKVDIITLIAVVTIALALSLLMFGFINWLKREKRVRKNEVKKDEVKIRIKGREYIYRPQKDLDGRYISLYFKNGEFIAFKSIMDLRNSIKSSFKKDPALVEQEIQEGRLIPIEH